MIIKLKPFQQDLAVVENRPALAKFLFELSQLVSSNSLDNEPLGIVVGLVGREKVEVLCRGGLTVDQVLAVSGQISETIMAGRVGREPCNILGNRQRNAEELAQQKIDYENANPWLCEYDGCPRRFKTERGAKQHESRCWYRKKQQ